MLTVELKKSVLEVIEPTKNAVEGVEYIMKAFNVDKKTAKELLDDAIAYAVGE